MHAVHASSPTSSLNVSAGQTAQSISLTGLNHPGAQLHSSVSVTVSFRGHVPFTSTCMGNEPEGRGDDGGCGCSPALAAATHDRKRSH